jgi:hypothetical protein
MQKNISSTVLTTQVNTTLNELQSSLAASLNLQLMSGLGINTMAYIPDSDRFPYQSIYLGPYHYDFITSPSSNCSCSEGKSP